MPTLEYKIQHIIIKLSTTPSGTKEGISLNCRSHAWLKRKTFLASNRLLDDIILSETIQAGQSNLWWVSGKEFLSCLKQNPRLYIHLKGDYDAECQFSTLFIWYSNIRFTIRDLNMGRRVTIVWWICFRRRYWNLIKKYTLSPVLQCSPLKFCDESLERTSFSKLVQASSLISYLSREAFESCDIVITFFTSTLEASKKSNFILGRLVHHPWTIGDFVHTSNGKTIDLCLHLLPYKKHKPKAASCNFEH